jgi:micrococcal nuclease
LADDQDDPACCRRYRPVRSILVRSFSENRERWPVNRRTLRFLLSLVVLIVFAIGAALGPTQTESSPHQNRVEAQIISIADGDTIRVKHRGQSILIRLIGIDAPESRESERATKQAQRAGTSVKSVLAIGQRSSKVLSDLLRNVSTVALEFDVSKTDHYGRTLAYVYRPDGLFLNREMVRLGFARPYSAPPNVKHQDEIVAAGREARTKRLGLWSYEHWGRPD